MWQLKKPTFSEIQERSNGNFNTAFQIMPLERGLGHTMGFALRRTLLGHLASFAICGVRISGVEHEFQTIQGLIEDGVELALNLKKIKFSSLNLPSEIDKNQVYSFYLKVDPNKEVIRVKDFNFQVGFEALQPDFILAHVGDDIRERKEPLEIEIFLRFDKGYADFKTNKRYYDMQIIKIDSKIHTGRFIAIDSDFSPVENAAFKVSELNSASNDIEEKLTLEIKTDGRISALTALINATKILAGSFAFGEDLGDLKEKLFTEERIKAEKSDSFDDPISKIGLSKRAENALRGENIHTVQSLIDYGNLEMIENIGKKTSQEIKNKLQEYIEKQQQRKEREGFNKKLKEDYQDLEKNSSDYDEYLPNN